MTARAKQGFAALPKRPQPSIQNAADATVTVSVCESDQLPVPCTDSMLTCCCQPAWVPRVHQPAWACTTCVSVKPQALTEQTCSLFVHTQRPYAVKAPAENKLLCCLLCCLLLSTLLFTKVTVPVCLMRLLVAMMPGMTTIVFSQCGLISELAHHLTAELDAACKTATFVSCCPPGKSFA